MFLFTNSSVSILFCVLCSQFNIYFSFVKSDIAYKSSKHLPHSRMDFTWKEFKENIDHVYRLSLKYADNWELVAHNTEPGHSYLRKQEKCLVNLDGCIDDINDALEEHISVDINDDSECVTSSYLASNHGTILQYEYHVLYQQSYGVPLLCFNAYKPDGSMLTITEAWHIFNRHYMSKTTTDTGIQHFGSILTEMDHPILFKPFLTLHPCRTTELLAALPDSTNKVITFLSSVGPAVNLRLDLRYGQAD